MIDLGDAFFVDPSIVSPGVALFRDGKLVSAARIKVHFDTSMNQAQRCIAAANEIGMWLHALGARVTTIGYEWPQIYAGSKQASNPNDLPGMVGVDLAITTALMIAAAARGEQLNVLCYTPGEWIGQVPKSRTGSALRSPRGRKIASRLDANELAVMPDQHDAIDAVGIGLHALGRLGTKRVLSSR